jgi:hypothetical protein
VVALDSGGRVWCWGSSRHGQLGVGLLAPPAQAQAPGLAAAQQAAGSTAPLRVPLPGPARDVAAGSEHSVAVLCDGGVWCWGWGEHGQLGRGGPSWGATADATAPLQVRLPGGAAAQAAAAAGAATFAW